MCRLARLLVVCSLVACGGSPRPAPAVAIRPEPVVRTKSALAPVPQTAPAVPAASVVPCWDGTGPAIEGVTTEVFAPPTMSKGYPAKIAVPDSAERARRETVLATRNPGIRFTLGETGDVTAITATRMSCLSQLALAAPRPSGKVPVGSPDDLALIAQLAARNPDVVAGLSFAGFVQAPDRTWSMRIASEPTAAYHRIATTLRAKTLSVAQTLAAFNKIARLERVRVIRGDSCGPQCGPPPMSTTVLGSRAITGADASVQRYTAVYLSPGALTIRKVAGLQLLAAGTQLSNGIKLIDAVTGEKVSSEPYDMFE